MSHQISYLKHPEINKAKWDSCVADAGNGSVYGYSFYLDSLAPHWDGLILNDYEAVMPLCWRRKFGFSYLYTPFFIQSLGVIGNTNKGTQLADFLAAIPVKFRFWDLKINHPFNGSFHGMDTSWRISPHVNFYLSLSPDYHGIRSGYSRLCNRMLQKAGKAEVRVDQNGLPEQVIRFYEKLYKSKHSKVTSANYNNLIRATGNCFKKGLAKVYLATLPDGEITAAYLVLVDNNFVYSLIGGSSEKGKQNGSFYLLTDAAIKEHAGSGRVFRFEGSDIKGIAFFNRQFGAEQGSYLNLVRNNLPFPFKLLK